MTNDYTPDAIQSRANVKGPDILGTVMIVRDAECCQDLMAFLGVPGYPKSQDNHTCEFKSGTVGDCFSHHGNRFEVIPCHSPDLIKIWRALDEIVVDDKTYYVGSARYYTPDDYWCSMLVGKLPSAEEWHAEMAPGVMFAFCRAVREERGMYL